MFSTSLHALRRFIHKCILFFGVKVFSRHLPPPPQPAVSFLRPRVFCVAPIRSLFLEIYDSFSEIRRDLCSSYFYCKSNSLEKKCNLYESFIFILACVKGTVPGSAEGTGRGSSMALTLNEAWRSLSRWPAVCLTIWVACSSSCSVSSESLLLLFPWPWIPSSTDRACKMGKGVERFV